MALPKFKTQAEIPDALKEDYHEVNGEWVYNDGGLRDNQRKLLDEKKQTDAKLAKLLGNRKPEDVEKILNDHETAEERRQREAGEFDQLVAKRVKQREDELLPEVEKGKTAQQKLAKLNFEIKTREFAEANGVNPKHMKAVLRTVENEHLRLDDDGETIIVLGPGGTKRSLAPEEFFKTEFKKDYPEFYLGTAGSGSGSTQTNRERNASPGAVDVRDTNALLANLDTVAKGQTPTF